MKGRVALLQLTPPCSISSVSFLLFPNTMGIQHLRIQFSYGCFCGMPIAFDDTLK